MSRKVDEHVVEMRFNNNDFEKKTAQTMSTLDKLKEKLNFESSARGLEKSVDSLNGLNNLNLSGLQKSISIVDMSLAAIAKNTIFTELTQSAINCVKAVNNAINKPINQIVIGGKARAKNIEQAKFQLEGLGVAWSNIEDDINYGVKDTAYGLDSAARVAAQLVASQVELGDDMKSALRGISGVAAMTNSTYDEIGSIFTTVAGNGRLMSMQLNQLATRGLNAAAALGKYLGKSEAEIREMTSKGAIDFKTFAMAMDETFGDHAKEANKTFDGALSNIKASLSRLGADVATSGFESLRQIMVEMIPVINLLKKAANPFINGITEVLESFTEAARIGIIKLKQFLYILDDEGNVVGGPLLDFFVRLNDWLSYTSFKILRFIRDFTDNGGLISLLNGLGNIIKAIKYPLIVVGTAFKNVFIKPMKSTSEYMKSFEEFTRKFVLTSNSANGLGVIFANIFKVLKIGVDIIKKITSLSMPLLDFLLNSTERFLGFIGKFSDTNYDIFGKMFNNSIMSNIKDKFPKALYGIVDIIVAIKNKISEVFTFIKGNDKYKQVVDRIEGLFSSVEGIINKGVDRVGSIGNLANIIDGLNVESLADGFIFVMDKLVWVFDKVESFFGLFRKGKDDITGVTNEINGVTKATNNMIGGLISIASNNKGKESTIFSGLFGDMNIFTKIGEEIQKLAGIIWNAIKKITESMDTGMLITEAFGISVVLMIKTISTTVISFKKLSDSVKNFFDNLNRCFKLKAEFKLSPFMQILISIGVIVASILALAYVYDKNPEGFSTAVGLVFAIGIFATAAIFILKKIQDFPKGAVKATNSIVSLCKSLALVALSIAMLTLVFKGRGLAGLGAVISVISIIAAFVGAIYVLNKIPNTSNALKTTASLISICLALNLLIGAIAALTLLFKLDTKNTALAITSVAALVVVLSFACQKISNEGTNLHFKVVINTGFKILSIAAAFLMVAEAIKLISTINIDKNVVVVLLTTVSIFAAMLLAVKQLMLLADNVDITELGKVTGLLLGIVTAFAIIAVVMKFLTTITFDKNLLINIGIVTVLLIGMLVLTQVLNKFSDSVDGNKILGAIKPIYAIIGIIAVLAIVLKLLETISLNKNIGVAIGTLIVIVSMIIVLMYVMSEISESKNNFKSIMAISTGLALLIGIFATSLMLLTLPDSDKLLSASSALAVAMVACAAIIYALSALKIDTKTVQNVVIMGTIIAAIVGIIAVSLYKLSQCDIPNMIASAIALGILLAAMVVVFSTLSKLEVSDPKIMGMMLTFSVVLIALGAAIAIIAYSLSLLANSVDNGYKLAAVITVLVGMAAVIGIICIALLALSEVSVPVVIVGLTLAAVLLSFAAAALTVGIVIQGVSLIILTLSNMFIYLVENIDLVGNALLKAIDYFVLFLIKLKDNAAQIGYIGSQIGIELVEGIVVGLATGIAGIIPKLMECGKLLLKAIWNGIKGEGFDPSEIEKVLGITKAAGKVVDDMGNDTSESLTSGITTAFNSNKADNAVDGFVSSIGNKLGSQTVNMDVIPNIDTSNLGSLDLGANLDLSSLNDSMSLNNDSINNLSDNVVTTGTETNNLTKETNDKLDSLSNKFTSLTTEVTNVKNKIDSIGVYVNFDGDDVVAMVDRKLGDRYQRNSKNFRYNTTKLSYS